MKFFDFRKGVFRKMDDPGKDNHHIDATRYALERFYKHKGN